MTKNRNIKIASASLAFVPLILGIPLCFGGLQSRALEIGVKIFYIPALTLARALQVAFRFGTSGYAISSLILMVLWSSLFAVMFWKIASACLAEDEPNGKFDWIGFQVRFFCGAVFGCFLGLRFWVSLYGGKHPPGHPGIGLAICVAAGAFLAGIAMGLGYREDFWRRP